MKKENKVEFGQSNSEPEIYSGMTTKGQNKAILPLCILIISFVLFIVIGLSMTYEGNFGIKGNYFYQTDREGRVSLMDGTYLLFFMFVALVCYFFNFPGWALGVETIVTIIEMVIAAGVASGEITDAGMEFFLLCGCVIASEISLILNLCICLLRKKGR